MCEQLTDADRQAMIDDIVTRQMDMLALAEKYGLTLDELARWVSDNNNRQCLGALCLLADLQTQLLLSRYRSLAANRLIRLATDEQSGGDVARKACVDLLKLDLKRADLDLKDITSGLGNTTSDARKTAVRQLRQLMEQAQDDPSGSSRHD